jgi:hypothetical protein
MRSYSLQRIISREKPRIMLLAPSLYYTEGLLLKNIDWLKVHVP